MQTICFFKTITHKNNKKQLLLGVKYGKNINGN